MRSKSCYAVSARQASLNNSSLPPTRRNFISAGPSHSARYLLCRIIFGVFRLPGGKQGRNWGSCAFPRDVFIRNQVYGEPRHRVHRCKYSRAYMWVGARGVPYLTSLMELVSVAPGNSLASTTCATPRRRSLSLSPALSLFLSLSRARPLAIVSWRPPFAPTLRLVVALSLALFRPVFFAARERALPKWK